MSIETFVKSKQEENTHVLDTTANRVKYRRSSPSATQATSMKPGRRRDDIRVLVRMPGCVNLLPVAVLALPVLVS